ncbi:unnamed protein product [Adineta ricciae]|uniref:ADP ribosyltransferase domain-containing protein n=1 Tax=Adineta ricciae TaxID=249248 RepID=A0A815RL37_ADIRI|nr:unnamed protein product [Adineta ricciae]CAF1508963.1 unnamed protein product [Adineta ricciae]
MGGKKSKPVLDSPDGATRIVQTSSDIRLARHIDQNYLLIWLNPYFNENNENCRNFVTHLRNIFSTIHTFTDVDHCIDYLTDVKKEKVFMIISSTIDQNLIHLIHDIYQLDSIYILRESLSWHEQWVTGWPKMKGIFIQLLSISRALKEVTKQCDQDLISLSFCSSNDNTSDLNHNELDQSFMYTQLFKEILLEIDYDEQAIEDFVSYYRKKYSNNDTNFDFINKFEREYYLHSPIWWYTHTWFLYSMVNRALRNMEVDIIIKLGFFISALHQHIEQLYTEQFASTQKQYFIVYRGQGLSTKDFEKLMKTKGGLISFNNFLSTSIDRDVSLAFADSNRNNPNTIGVLFKMTIDPRISSSPFARLDNTSCFMNEQEILFSMHTVFRIDSLEPFVDNQHIWQVALTLTNNIDQQLNSVADGIRHRLSRLSEPVRLIGILSLLANFEEAEDLLNTVDSQMFDGDDKAGLSLMAGYLKLAQEDYGGAMSLLTEALDIFQKNPTQNYLSIAFTYSSIGSVYFHMGEYLRAISFYEKAMENFPECSSSNDNYLALIYKSVGLVHSKMGEYSKAIFFHKKAIAIYQKESLPGDDIHLVLSYKDLGFVYENMKDYSTSVYFYEKGLQLYQRIVLPNHLHLSIYYKDIASVYFKMHNYHKALQYCQQALQICQKCLPSNHLRLGEMYSLIGRAYNKMGEYSKGVAFSKKALKILTQ